MNNMQVLGKFLDQPILVSKFKKAVPAVLTGGAAAYTAYDALKEEKGKRKERALKTGITLGTTVAAALAAPHIASAITKRPLPANLNAVKTKNKELVDSFINTNETEKPVKDILNKSKEKILSFKEVKTLYTNVKEKPNGKEFLEKLIPSPENIKAKDIFSEIGYLSIYGAVPVAGGIAGGIASDITTDRKHWRKKVPNKIKEGSYQYLANIFMCNVGAGAALGLLEKAGITSKGARAAGMTAGIITTGIIGGSKIANFIGKNVIDPIFNKKKIREEMNEDVLDINFSDKKIKNYIYKSNPQKKEKERTPELLDISLHTDDIATVSLLSGLKWIEPALPIMYTLSGYRAGIGYRN
ncbi:MAG: hypothetical protein LUH05_00150 [Candidatus Gastranaerophilales bacterium]|nr:hypothetical protein [Candidatus Gastranaerophilales bacterium]